MTTQQLSIFMENKPEQLVKVTETLAEGGIDIRAMSLADTQDFGIVRMIVSDCAKAQAMLSARGLMSSITKVMLAAIPDQPGGLGVITKALSDAKINIDYLYACITILGKCAYIVLHVDDEEKATAALNTAGIQLATAEELNQL